MTSTVATRAFNDDELRAITPDNIFDTLAAEHIPVTDIGEVLGTGFEVTAKSDLVGTPMVILDWRVNEDGNFGEFISILAVTPDEKVVINDGGSGSANQLRTLVASGVTGAIRVPKGLRVSTYYYDPKNPVNKSNTPEKGYAEAKTYYLSA